MLYDSSIKFVPPRLRLSASMRFALSIDIWCVMELTAALICLRCSEGAGSMFLSLRSYALLYTR